MSHLSAWAPALVEGTLPAVHGKNLLGAIAGASLAILCVQWLLRVRTRFPDALGLVLPIAILVGRFGCLLTGCCHGTATSLPWAIRYPAGSVTHHHHVADGLIPPAAAASLPIHPVQVYEMLLVIPLVWLVLRLHPRLRRRGSTLIIAGIGYACIRFAQEFLRDGGAVSGGLKTVQWSLLVVVVAGGVLLWRREASSAPHAERCAAPLTTARITALGALGLLVIGIAVAWLDALECFWLGLCALPLLWHGWEHAARALVPGLPIRWRRGIPITLTALALSAWMPLYKTDRGSPKSRHALRFELGGGGGYVKENYSCDDTEDWVREDIASFEGTVAYQYHITDRTFFETGARGYLARITSDEDVDPDPREWSASYVLPVNQTGVPAPYNILGTELYAGIDEYWAACFVGLHVFTFPHLDANAHVMASGKVRFFPEDVFFVEWSFLHDTLAVTGPFSLGGIGFTLGPVGRMRLGLGFQMMGGIPFYIRPEFTFLKIGDHQIVISPEIYINNGDSTRTATGGLIISVGVPLD